MTILIPFEQPSAAPRVLVLAGDPAAAEAWCAALQSQGRTCRRAISAAECIAHATTGEYDLVVCDASSPIAGAAELAERLRDNAATLQAIVVHANHHANCGNLDAIAFACFDGAPSAAELEHSIGSGVRHSRLVEQHRRLKRRLAQRRGRELVGQSSQMERLRQQIVEIAAIESPVLIQGERGTGKEVIARAIHDASERAYRPFIKVNCGVLTSVSLERELFGCTPAAGVDRPEDRVGRLEMAHGGVLLLDDVSEVALPLQLKLLRAFESRGFEKLGTSETIPLNVRVIATHSSDLKQLVAQGHFRADLYAFLCQNVLDVPALRERADDISALTEHFLNQAAVREGKPVRRLPLDTLQLLRGYNWPGNVRELENLVDRACAVDLGLKLTADMLRPWLAGEIPEVHTIDAGLTLREMERKLIESTFARFGGNRERTAQALQIGLRTLSGKLREYGYPPRGGPGSNQLRRESRAA